MRTPQAISLTRAGSYIEQIGRPKETERPRPVFATPGELAKAVNPKTVQTPALQLIDSAIVRAYKTPNARWIGSLPPQEGKTTRATVFGSLWMLLQNPAFRIGVISYSQDLADEFGGEVRNIITVNDGTDGELDLGLRIAKDYGAKSRWKLEGSRGGLLAVGLSGSITGRPLDALFIDDPVKNQQDADSQQHRDHVWNVWQSAASTRLAPGAPVIVVMTRWQEDDLAGRLKAAEDGHLWDVLNIPALADHDPAKGQTDPLGRQPGEWLTSARGRSVADWEAIRVRSGSRVFNALYQGRPSPESGNVWKRGWWRRYDTLPWTLNDDGAYRVDADEVIQSWDMAFKDTKGSDFVVGQVWARKGATCMLLDQVHKRLSFTDTLVAFKTLCRKWPQATAKLVEDKANGTAVIDTLRSQIAGIVPVTPTESKYARANAVAPFVEAGNALLPAAEVALFDVDALINEAAAFPNGAHDDQVDATSQALARLLLDGTGATAWTEYLRRRAAADTEQPASPAELDVVELDPREAARQAAFAAANH